MSAKANQIGDLIKAIKADPKKTGSLGVLLLVFGILLSRQFLGGSTSRPATAGAMAVNSSMTLPQNGGGQPGVFDSAARSGGSMLAVQKWSQEPIQPVSRNLFAVRMDYFPMESSRTTLSGPEDDGFWLKLEKSINQRTDDRQRHENMIASFTVDAEKLKLQSVMMGPIPRAMIDGQLVGEGSVVADFRVVRIETRQVVVEREGIRLAIRMK